MGIDYDFNNDLNGLYNGAINYDVSNADHEKMLTAYNNLIAHITHDQHWRDTALELSRMHGEAEADANRLAAEYEATLREIGGVFWEEPGEKSPALITHKNRRRSNGEMEKITLKVTVDPYVKIFHDHIQDLNTAIDRLCPIVARAITKITPPSIGRENTADFELARSMREALDELTEIQNREYRHPTNQELLDTATGK